MVERYITKARRKITLDAGIKGFIYKTAKRNYWRVSAWYEFDDLVQDGYLCYAKCLSRFNFKSSYEPEDAPSNEEMRKFMCFLSAAFSNHITDLANERTVTPELALASFSEEQAEAIELTVASEDTLSDANLQTLLMKAPIEIAEMLKALLIDGLAEGRFLKKRLRKKDLPSGSGKSKHGSMQRETSSEFYDRCLNQQGVVEKLWGYFAGAEEEPLIDQLAEKLMRVASMSTMDETEQHEGSYAESRN